MLWYMTLTSEAAVQTRHVRALSTWLTWLPSMDICRAFDKLKEVRQLEYELDFAQNRARRDLTALQAKLDAMNATRCACRHIANLRSDSSPS
jgi:hypothetical protein